MLGEWWKIKVAGGFSCLVLFRVMAGEKLKFFWGVFSGGLSKGARVAATVQGCQVMTLALAIFRCLHFPLQHLCSEF